MSSSSHQFAEQVNVEKKVEDLQKDVQERLKRFQRFLNDQNNVCMRLEIDQNELRGVMEERLESMRTSIEQSMRAAFQQELTGLQDQNRGAREEEMSCLKVELESSLESKLEAQKNNLTQLFQTDLSKAKDEIQEAAQTEIRNLKTAVQKEVRTLKKQLEETRGEVLAFQQQLETNQGIMNALRDQFAETNEELVRLRQTQARNNLPEPELDQRAMETLVTRLIDDIFPIEGREIRDDSRMEYNPVHPDWAIVFKIVNETVGTTLEGHRLGNVSGHNWNALETPIRPRRKIRFSYGAGSRQGLYEIFSFDISGSELCLVMVMRLHERQFAIGLIPKRTVHREEDLARLYARVFTTEPANNNNAWPIVQGGSKMQGIADQVTLQVEEGAVEVTAFMHIEDADKKATFTIELPYNHNHADIFDI